MYMNTILCDIGTYMIFTRKKSPIKALCLHSAYIFGTIDREINVDENIDYKPTKNVTRLRYLIYESTALGTQRLEARKNEIKTEIFG